MYSSWIPVFFLIELIFPLYAAISHIEPIWDAKCTDNTPSLTWAIIAYYRKLRDALVSRIKDLCLGFICTSNTLHVTGYRALKINTFIFVALLYPLSIITIGIYHWSHDKHDNATQALPVCIHNRKTYDAWIVGWSSSLSLSVLHVFVSDISHHIWPEIEILFKTSF